MKETLPINRIICKDSRTMSELPDSSVHLIVTSPPYNAGKDYDNHEDLMPLDEYLTLLRDVWVECKRVLVDGGRICINVANIGRKPYVPLNAHIAKQMLDLGFLMRGEVIWNKEASVGSSTAWGSWRSPSNPTLRDTHEYIMIFSKDNLRLPNHRKAKPDITKDEFLSSTKSIWSFATASAKKVGHPAPFPDELPRRIIKLYSYPNDIVLDPFVGSGTTCVVAKQLGRRYVGYDISEKYCKLAERRIKDETSQRNLKTI